jgi:hypothetical protein
MSNGSSLAWYILVFAIILPIVLCIGGIIGGIAYACRKKKHHHHSKSKAVVIHNTNINFPN